LGIPLACHRVAPDGHATGDWKRLKNSGTQGDVRNYASLCNFYSAGGGCASYKSMYINILGLILFWS